MAINVCCPNEACRKMLSVRDDFAGKTGKCPNCGTTMPIPDPAADAMVEVSEAGPAEHERDNEEIPVRPYRDRGRRDVEDARRRRRYRERDEEYEDDTTRIPKAKGSPAATIVCLSLGILFLIWLGLAPIFSMYSNTFPNEPASRQLPFLPGSGGMIGLVEGKILMIVSLVGAALCIAGLIVYLTASSRVGATFVTICGCIGGGWGLAALFWVLGFLWDVNTMSPVSQSAPNSHGMGMAPGPGLWLGLGVAIATVAVFSALFSFRGQVVWLYLGEGLGFMTGVLLVCLNVQPWNTEEGHRFQPRPNSKLFRRYWVLQPYLESAPVTRPGLLLDIAPRLR